MKYTISINQLVLSKTKLDIKDCAILEYIKAFCAVDDKKVKQMEITDGGATFKYTWINFNHLIKEMPLIRIKSKGAISERIKNLEKAGFVKTHMAPDRSIYVRVLPKVKETEFGGVLRGEQPVLQTEQGVLRDEQEVFSKPNSTSSISTNHKISNPIAANAAEVEFDFKTYLTMVRNDKQKHIRIIGDYWDMKEFAFESKAQAEGDIIRNVKIARALAEYSEERIMRVMDWLYGNADFPWKLETVLKFINEDLSKLRSFKKQKTYAKS